ncbi:MAG TPA: hypothetical protein VK705_10430 [Ferruginibacter sp.]|jgi:hypothetical protein|nr:hypothetical protein [Ferruginibacter sp.]
MKKLSLLTIFLFICFIGSTQPITKTDLKFLHKKEDSLKIYSVKLLQGINDIDRFKADSIFTRVFVRALKTTNSFYYPFDSVESVSKLYAPDSSFRIYTWQMVVNENMTRQHGAIQMKTADGSLKLFPLIDKSDIMQNISDSVGDNKGWVGAVYYRIVEKKDKGQNIYTLLGYDENNIRSTKKIIEILQFVYGQPVFGDPIFSFEKDSINRAPISRYVLEFKKDAGARLAYDDDMGMIIFEHLISETNEPKKKWTYIGDGDYEGFKWVNGKWLHVEKVFTQVTPDGQAPVPKPVNGGGNLLDDKLPKQ